MKTVQILFVTAPIEKSRAREFTLELRKRIAEVNVRLIGSFLGEGPLVLTPRQREVLERIAIGDSAKQIAVRLGISAKTVETHRASLMERLGIHRIPDLVRYAIQTGVVRADWLARKGLDGNSSAIPSPPRSTRD